MRDYLKNYALGVARLNQYLRSLPQSQLIPIIEAASMQSGITSYGLTVETFLSGFPGVGGEKTIPTFHYATNRRKTGRISMFVKRTDSNEELLRFRALQDAGLPVPTLHGVVADISGRQTLFMEYLAGEIQLSRLDDLRSTIDLIAQVNACPTPSLYAKPSSTSLAATCQRDWHSMLAGLWPTALRGDYGDDMRALCSRRCRSEIEDLIDWLADELASVEGGFNMQRYWEMKKRKTDGSLVLYDAMNFQHSFRFLTISALWARVRRERWNPWVSGQKFMTDYLGSYSRMSGSMVATGDIRSELELMLCVAGMQRFGDVLYVNKHLLGAEGTDRETYAGISRVLDQGLTQVCEAARAMRAGTR